MLFQILEQTQEISGLAETGTESLKQIQAENPILSFLLIFLTISIIGLAFAIHKISTANRKTIEKKDAELRELNKHMTNNAVENLRIMKDYEANLDRISQSLQIVIAKIDDFEEIANTTKFLKEWVTEKYLKN